MSKVIMLTQDKCPKCTALKSYLEMGLRNKYQEDIEVIHRQEDPERFMELVHKHSIMATPVLISENEVLVDTAPSKVSVFLEKNV
ncbi:MAG: glutaredoxin [Erysipelothrix sp.]